ncbi:AfsR/SARP family transcriptional regulator [Jatrophihabitans sp. DSM 45814]
MTVELCLGQADWAPGGSEALERDLRFGGIQADSAGCRPEAATEYLYRVYLFGSLRLYRGGAEVVLKSREQRLIALLALEGYRPRSYLAGRLWPETTEARAAGSLRAAVCRIERAAPGLLRVEDRQVGFGPSVSVDLDEFQAHANELSMYADAVPDGDDAEDRPGDQRCLQSLRVLLRAELLSGWYDDWVIYERERLQQLRLCALEALATTLRTRGLTAAALTAALGATAIEPLRESAHRALIRVHLDDGNFHAAIREYRSFRRRMMTELGVRPSPQMDALIRPLMQRLEPVGSPRTASHPAKSGVSSRPAFRAAG